MIIHLREGHNGSLKFRVNIVLEGVDLRLKVLLEVQVQRLGERGKDEDEGILQVGPLKWFREGWCCSYATVFIPSVAIRSSSSNSIRISSTIRSKDIDNRDIHSLVQPESFQLSLSQFIDVLIGWVLNYIGTGAIYPARGLLENVGLSSPWPHTLIFETATSGNLTNQSQPDTPPRLHFAPVTPSAKNGPVVAENCDTMTYPRDRLSCHHSTARPDQGPAARWKWGAEAKGRARNDEDGYKNDAAEG
ncbi:hypothetical protein BD779DRAFT_1477887 [Infundibulicybe gibba]|nr:hypothetical protein BD779DRAFT_1477887 [Infundibulicybe gibba]